MKKDNQKIIVITRHSGLIEFLKDRLGEFDTLPHLSDPSQVEGYDEVWGVLPLHLVEQLLHRGKRVVLTLLPQIPPELRGKEIDSKTLESLGVEFREVTSLVTSPVSLSESEGVEE